MISIRGLVLAVKEYSDFYEGKPLGIVLTNAQFRMLCREAARSGKPFADENDAGELPTFSGIPVATFEEDEAFTAEVIAVAQGEAEAP